MIDTLDKIRGILYRKWGPDRIQGISQRRDAETRERSKDRKGKKNPEEEASKERLVDTRA